MGSGMHSSSQGAFRFYLSRLGVLLLANGTILTSSRLCQPFGSFQKVGALAGTFSLTSDENCAYNEKFCKVAVLPML